MENKENNRITINRRDTLKSILIGGLAITSFSRCAGPEDDDSDNQPANTFTGYGRTAEEELHDKKIFDQPSFFTEHEAETLVDLVDIIVPRDEKSGSANDAGVMDFLDFIVKDMTYHQMPLRQGLAWLDRKSNEKYNSNFVSLESSLKTELLDLIAYPDEVKDENIPGEKFFSKLRDLTLTGFYTSKIGIDDLGYVGNRPNFWDGIPSDVMEEYGFHYDEKYRELYIREETRTQTAEWDEKGNIING